MNSFELKNKGITNEHAYKADITGRKGNSDLDICLCENGKIRLRAVGKCNRTPGANDPDIPAN
jgi:hypothetical protein